MSFTRRRILSATGAAGAALALPVLAQAQSGAPVRIGSTLALTGPLSATAMTHKLVGEIYVEQLNKRGGLLGRQVQWIVKDDQSKPDLARTLYEQLVTSEKVDLLMGPYATGAILSAMGVAKRYGKVLVHHTFGIPSLAKYDMQFPAWSLGPNPQVTVSNTLFDMLAASKKPLMVLGGAGWSKGAAHYFTEFAERIGIPVAAAFRRQDAVPNSSSVYAGNLGYGPNPQLIERVIEGLYYEDPAKQQVPRLVWERVDPFPGAG